MKRNKSFKDSSPLLYLVATPIGNLQEVSPRALSVFTDCDLIACEDTRNTKNLLSHLGISKELISVREHNEREASLFIIKKILDGKKVVYVSDAGYPGISDPGSILVDECIKNGIKVSTVSGSCAFINALVASGLDTTHFYFHGFLSAKEVEAKKELETLKNKNETLIFYESPHRIIKTLNYLYEILGDRKITLARELTKINEEYIYSTLQEIITIDPNTLIGEMVLIVEGNKEQSIISDEEILKRVGYFLEKGLSKKDSAEIVSFEYKINKNYVKKLIK